MGGTKSTTGRTATKRAGINKETTPRATNPKAVAPAVKAAAAVAPATAHLAEPAHVPAPAAAPVNAVGFQSIKVPPAVKAALTLPDSPWQKTPVTHAPEPISTVNLIAQPRQQPAIPPHRFTAPEIEAQAPMPNTSAPAWTETGRKTLPFKPAAPAIEEPKPAPKHANESLKSLFSRLEKPEPSSVVPPVVKKPSFLGRLGKR